jgi:hypothetical protein
LRGAYKEASKATTSDLLHQCDIGGEGFMSQIIIRRDEIWVYCFEAKFKQKSVA